MAILTDLCVNACVTVADVGREHQFLMHSIGYLSWVMYTLKIRGEGEMSRAIC